MNDQVDQRAHSQDSDSPRSLLSLDMIPGLAGLGDCFVILLSALACWYTLAPTYDWVPDRLILLTLIAWGTTLLAMFVIRAYRFEVIFAPLRSVRPQILAIAITYGALWILGQELLEGRAIALAWLKAFVITAPIGLLTLRLAQFLVLYVMAVNGRLSRKIALFGTGKQAEKLLEHIQQERPVINHVIGVFDDRTGRHGPTCGGVPVYGSLEKLYECARSKSLDEVIIALPWSAADRIHSVIKALADLPIKIRIASDMITFQFPGQIVSDDLFRGLPMFDVVNKPLMGWSRLLKSIEDKVLAAIAVILLSPIMILVALAVAIESPGPILFRQKRFGFNNQEFSVLKFRSMTHANDPEAGTRQASRNDARVTRVGRFIRRTSLDELPQLFNVLNGTMSLVGPRPHTVQHNKQYAQEIDGYFARHKVKPGITGWAQVNGLRGETNTLEKMEYRVRYDIYYIENWSLFFDLEILILTVLLGITGRNAY